MVCTFPFFGCRHPVIIGNNRKNNEKYCVIIGKIIVPCVIIGKIIGKIIVRVEIIGKIIGKIIVIIRQIIANNSV